MTFLPSFGIARDEQLLDPRLELGERGFLRRRSRSRGTRASRRRPRRRAARGRRRGRPRWLRHSRYASTTGLQLGDAGGRRRPRPAGRRTRRAPRAATRASPARGSSSARSIEHAEHAATVPAASAGFRRRGQPMQVAHLVAARRADCSANCVEPGVEVVGAGAVGHRAAGSRGTRSRASAAAGGPSAGLRAIARRRSPACEPLRLARRGASRRAR